MKRIFLALTSLFLCAGCVGAPDTEAPKINNVTLPEIVYTGAPTKIVVDAVDNSTETKDINYQVRIAYGTQLIKADGLSFIVDEPGEYSLSVKAYDKAGNESESYSTTFNAIDLGEGWSDDEKALFKQYFNRNLPYCDSLTNQHQVSEYTFTSKNAKGILIEDAQCGDITTKYRRVFELAGYTFKSETTLSDGNKTVSWPAYIYSYSDPTDEEPGRFINIQIDYFPGNENNAACFEVFASYDYSQELVTLDHWDFDMIGKAILSQSVALNIIPEYQTKSTKFVYNDLHKSLGYGALYIDIFNTNADEVKAWCESATVYFLGAQWAYDAFMGVDKNADMVLYTGEDSSLDFSVAINISNHFDEKDPFVRLFIQRRFTTIEVAQ